MNELVVENKYQQADSQGGRTIGNSVRHQLFLHLGPTEGQKGFPTIENAAHGCSVPGGEARRSIGRSVHREGGFGCEHGTGTVIKNLEIPTLGENMIVFYDHGTGKYNKRVHGGDIRLKS